LVTPTNRCLWGKNNSRNIPDAMFHKLETDLVTPLMAASAISSVTSSIS
jgi:hypothetical protein